MPPYYTPPDFRKITNRNFGFVQRVNGMNGVDYVFQLPNTEIITVTQNVPNFRTISVYTENWVPVKLYFIPTIDQIRTAFNIGNRVFLTTSNTLYEYIVSSNTLINRFAILQNAFQGASKSDDEGILLTQGGGIRDLLYTNDGGTIWNNRAMPLSCYAGDFTRNACWFFPNNNKYFFYAQNSVAGTIYGYSMLTNPATDPFIFYQLPNGLRISRAVEIGLDIYVADINGNIWLSTNGGITFALVFPIPTQPNVFYNFDAFTVSDFCVFYNRAYGIQRNGSIFYMNGSEKVLTTIGHPYAVGVAQVTTPLLLPVGETLYAIDLNGALYSSLQYDT